jgi:hypothetical protein
MTFQRLRTPTECPAYLVASAAKNPRIASFTAPVVLGERMSPARTWFLASSLPSKGRKKQ